MSISRKSMRLWDCSLPERTTGCVGTFLVIMLAGSRRCPIVPLTVAKNGRCLTINPSQSTSGTQIGFVTVPSDAHLTLSVLGHRCPYFLPNTICSGCRLDLCQSLVCQHMPFWWMVLHKCKHGRIRGRIQIVIYRRLYSNGGRLCVFAKSPSLCGCVQHQRTLVDKERVFSEY